MPKSFIKNRFGSKAGLKNFLIENTLGTVGFYRAYSRPLRQFDRIVFVCKGNICRSPFAEALVKTKSMIPTASFGLDTTTGKTANEKIAALSRTFGIDLATHRTTNISDFKAQSNDIYLCFEPKQCKQLADVYPADRIYLLGAVSEPKNYYIHDPYSSNEEHSLYVIAHIHEKVMQLISSLSGLKHVQNPY